MKRASAAVRIPVLAAAATAVSLASGAARPVVGQEVSAVRVHVTADVGASLHDSFDGPRLGGDMLIFALRLTAERPMPGGLQPWADGARFVRPGFDCVSGLSCTDSGWLARAGANLPLSDYDQPGLQASARGGLGAGFADEVSISYLIGLELHWRSVPWISPIAELRWEHIAGINFTIIAAGLRIHP